MSKKFKFKIGDKVKIIKKEKDSRAIVGHVHTITELRRTFEFCYTLNGSGQKTIRCSEKQLELI